MLPVKFSALGTASVWNLDEYAEGVRQFQPKVRASREPWDKFQIPTNPERVRGLANPFRVQRILDVLIPGLSLRSNSGLKLANAFGVFIQFKLKHYPALCWSMM